MATPVPELAAEREPVTNPAEEDAVVVVEAVVSAAVATAVAAVAVAIESTVRRVVRGDPGDPTRRMGDAALLPLPLPLLLVLRGPDPRPVARERVGEAAGADALRRDWF